MRVIRQWIYDHPCTTVLLMVVAVYFAVAISLLYHTKNLPSTWKQLKEVLHDEKRGSIDGKTYPYPKGRD